MKELLKTLVMILLIMLFAATVFAESTVVKFSDPSNPGLIKTSGSGNITITGYNGSDVIIETDSKEENVLNPPENEKTKGLKRISSSTVNVTQDKDENSITISRSIQHETNLAIKVPFNTSFKTGLNGNKENNSTGNIQNLVLTRVLAGMGGVGMLEGDIDVKNISGDIEASTVEGDITLTDISGIVLANTIEGNIEITFKEYKKNKPMSFSTIEGDVDVTLPSALKADLKIKNLDGDVFTDFDIKVMAVSTEEQNSVNVKSSTRVDTFVWNNIGAMLGNNIYGKINGGGAEIRITTLDGNIYVRKGK